MRVLPTPLLCGMLGVSRSRMQQVFADAPLPPKTMASTPARRPAPLSAPTCAEIIKREGRHQNIGQIQYSQVVGPTVAGGVCAVVEQVEAASAHGGGCKIIFYRASCAGGKTNDDFPQNSQRHVWGTDAFETMHLKWSVGNCLVREHLDFEACFG